MIKNYDVAIEDNGAAYLIVVRYDSNPDNRLVVAIKRSLGDAWRHIKQMYEVENQLFYIRRKVGMGRVRVDEWVDAMKSAGYLD